MHGVYGHSLDKQNRALQKEGRSLYKNRQNLYPASIHNQEKRLFEEQQLCEEEIEKRDLAIARFRKAESRKYFLRLVLLGFVATSIVVYLLYF